MENSRRETTMRFLAQPTDINFGGKVHGGMIMKWIDEAGYACATSWSGHYCVTAHVGEVSFYTPVKVGSMVELNAKVIYTGRTSMHIAVRVSSCDLRECEMTGAIRCVLIFVALDDNGKPTAIPPWIPETKDDIALETYAKCLVELRPKIYQELGDIKVKW